MVKVKHSWIPAIWGWLPDKTEESYKVFFLLVQDKLNEMDLSFKLTSIISDFELNIMKAIDDILDVDILGCFFHLTKAFKNKVDKKGFKTRYETDKMFNQFIKESGALVHLPLEDLIDGLKHIEEKFVFKDIKGEEFKSYFIQYIRDFWINGCYPPHVWNCFERSEDMTNNNQEGFNSKMNKSLEHKHPSPGILLCHIVQGIKLAEGEIAKVRVGISKPKQQPKYKKLAERRLLIKKAYIRDKSRGQADIGAFLSDIGHNVMASTHMGRITQEKHLQAETIPSVNVDEIGELDRSTWNVEEASSMECVEIGTNPYAKRKVGKTLRVQEAEEERTANRCEWIARKCPSCNKGFKRSSNTVRCHSCDSFTHKKSSCLSSTSQMPAFHCKKCLPNSAPVNRGSDIERAADGNFTCKHCDFVTKTKYNLKRHMDRKHIGQSEDIQTSVPSYPSIPHIASSPLRASTPLRKSPSVRENGDLYSVLKSEGLGHLVELLRKEKIDLNILMEMEKNEFIEIGVESFGDRHKLFKLLKNLKENGYTQNDEQEHTILDGSFNENEQITKECDNCNELFLSESQLARHYNEVHMVVICPHCDTQFKDVGGLNEHVENNHTNFLHVSVCSQQSHTSSHWSKVYCPRCKGMFDNEKDLSDHIENCHGAVLDGVEENGEVDIPMILSPEEKFHCNECDSSFSYQCTLQLHIKNNHTGNKFCCQCNFRTTSDKKLEEHIMSLHNPMEYSSDINDSNTSILPQKRSSIIHSSTETSISMENTEISLNASKRRKPTSEFNCEICQKSFSNKFNLQRHIKNVHKK